MKIVRPAVAAVTAVVVEGVEDMAVAEEVVAAVVVVGVATAAVVVAVAVVAGDAATDTK